MLPFRQSLAVLLCSVTACSGVHRAPEIPVTSSSSGAFAGMFRYMADAAMITLCADGRRLPVAMERDYLALESAYLKAASQPGQPVLVHLDGLIALRPSMEESNPPLPTMVVERFIDIWPNASCP